MGDSALRGLVGEIVTRVRGPVEPGEVRLLFHGSYETLLAYSERPMSRGAVALVTGPRGAGAVDVIPWVLDGISLDATPPDGTPLDATTEPGATGTPAQSEE